jgi:general L-amino acid transport system permease protein
MSHQTRQIRSGTTRVAFWRDVRVLRVAVQVGVLAIVILLLSWLANNMSDGLRRAGIPTDFNFLNQVSGFQIDEGFVDQPHQRDESYLHAFIIGLGNTLRVIFFSLFLSTMLGLVMGVARLSTNWLLRNIAVVYIEIMQNTPLLLQLFFIYSGVFLTLPGVRQAIELPGPSYLSVRGLAIPALQSTANTTFWLVITLLGGIVGTLLWKRLRQRRINTGQATYAAETGLGVMVLVGGLSWLTLTPFTVSLPRIQGFGYVRGAGAVISPEFVALVVGLSLYTGAFIAEAVRSGIQSVPTGQWEAARSQGLTYLQTLRLVVLPQALRVIIPPLTNQYLNLSKNSSLGAAIGFFDLFGVARTAQQSVPVVPVVVIVMATYLLVSLTTAFLMNMLNARVQLRVR